MLVEAERQQVGARSGGGVCAGGRVAGTRSWSPGSTEAILGQAEMKGHRQCLVSGKQPGLGCHPWACRAGGQPGSQVAGGSSWRCYRQMLQAASQGLDCLVQ